MGLVIIAGIAFAIWRKTRTRDSNFEVLTRGSIIESVYGIGTLTAVRSFSIKSGVTSTIHRLFVKEGDFVKKGARLVELEGIGSFEAPFAGTVVSAPFKKDETIYAQTSVLTLVDPSETYILVSVEQEGALNLKAQLPVKISFDGLRDQTFDGKVESVYSKGPDFLARITTDKLPKSILPGMTADVAIILQEKKDVLLAPVAALEQKNLVVSRNGKSVRVPVTTGLVDGAYIEITGGDVKAGDQSIILKKTAK